MAKRSGAVIRTAIAVSALAGAAIMAYLAKLHFTPNPDAFCNIGEGLSCDLVNSSAYATLFGIPLSVLGFFYFFGIFALVSFKYHRRTQRLIALVSVAFLGPSLYLTGIELFVLKNICVFCELSKLLIIGIIISSVMAWRPKKKEYRSLAAAAVLGVLLAGATWLIQSRSGRVPPGTYDAFATCVAEKRLRMYGSVTCAYCARQRELFGDSFRFVEEIECDPRNPNHEAERCIAKNVSKTPTWILEDENGADVYRFPSGVVPLEELSRVSGCPLPNL